MSSKKNKLVRNSFFNLIGWVWLTLLTVFSVPYMVNKLGIETYGVLILVTTVMGYFAFLDIGLTESVVRYIAEAKANNDFEYLNRVVGSSLVFYLIIGGAGGSLLFLFADLLITKVFTISPALINDARFGIYLSSVGFAVNMLLGVLTKVTEGLQRFDVSNKMSIVIGTLNIGGNIFLLAVGFHIRALLIFNFVVSIIAVITALIVNKTIQPEISFFPSFSKEIFKKMTSFGVNTFVARIESFISTNINNFFVASLLGTGALTFFNIPFRLVGRINSIIYRLSFTLFPMAAEFTAQGEKERLVQIYLKASRTLFLLSSTVFIPIIFFSKGILTVWLGREYAEQGWQVMALISAALYLTSLTMVPSLIANGIGNPRINTFFATVTLTVNTILVYPLTSKFGVIGSASSLLISVLHAPISIYFINKRIMHIDPLKYFREIFHRISVVVLFLIAVAYVMHVVAFGTFLFILSYAVSTAVIALIFVLYPKSHIDNELCTMGWEYCMKAAKKFSLVFKK